MRPLPPLWTCLHKQMVSAAHSGPPAFCVFGMQSIPCSTPRRRKRAAPYNRNTPRKGKYGSRALPNTSPTPEEHKHNALCP